MNDYNSKGFKELQKKWYKTLKKDGFKDIEYDDFSDSELKTEIIEYDATTRHHYKQCEWYLLNHDFKSKTEELIFRFYTEGKTYFEISQFLRKIQINKSKDAVRMKIKRLLKKAGISSR